MFFSNIDYLIFIKLLSFYRMLNEVTALLTQLIGGFLAYFLHDISAIRVSFLVVGDGEVVLASFAAAKKVKLIQQDLLANFPAYKYDIATIICQSYVRQASALQRH
jgi:hypothetical protein